MNIVLLIVLGSIAYLAFGFFNVVLAGFIDYVTNDRANVHSGRYDDTIVKAFVFGPIMTAFLLLVVVALLCKDLVITATVLLFKNWAYRLYDLGSKQRKK